MSQSFMRYRSRYRFRLIPPGETHASYPARKRNSMQRAPALCTKLKNVLIEFQLRMCVFSISRRLMSRSTTRRFLRHNNSRGTNVTQRIDTEQSPSGRIQEIIQGLFRDKELPKAAVPSNQPSARWSKVN
ncbi:uncharacterized protein LOC120359830 [Solenopsis invicta]|uniref:uncharacterized protein LOC120359830 n=1 Tax=Solenopsis invicta TaxID=13686 RepID=UPI00193E8FB6|nr:uncharacterized protein LOC120359830 [Solenopsis invicta]